MFYEREKKSNKNQRTPLPFPLLIDTTVSLALYLCIKKSNSMQEMLPT